MSHQNEYLTAIGGFLALVLSAALIAWLCS